MYKKLVTYNVNQSELRTKKASNSWDMKFLASLLATLAIANPVPADEPAPASGDTQMDTSIIMINMNSANIQVSTDQP